MQFRAHKAQSASISEDKTSRSKGRRSLRGLPIIMCPVCGQHMRLTTIVPEDNKRQRMSFACGCGFDYHQSEAVASERDL